MELAMNMNHKLVKVAPLVQKPSKRNKLFSKTNKNLVISCNMSMQCNARTNFYQVLSLDSQNVGFDEIKKAYKALALLYHPDVNSCSTPLTKEESTKRFIELRKAYETLSDPDARRMYDYELYFGNNSHGSCCVEKRRSGDGIRKEVWERQLSGLRKRSAERMMMKKKLY